LKKLVIGIDHRDFVSLWFCYVQKHPKMKNVPKKMNMRFYR